MGRPLSGGIGCVGCLLALRRPPGVKTLSLTIRALVVADTVCDTKAPSSMIVTACNVLALLVP